jgi:two-component system, NarL family, nitrate/nitrite response regulator NarL
MTMPTQVQAPEPPLAVVRLTPREADVLRLVAHGLTDKAIAQRLDLRLGTVKTHLNKSYRKLGVHSRVQAAEAFRRWARLHDIDLTPDEEPSLPRLLSHIEPAVVAAGTVLFRKGDKADGIYFLVHGTVLLDELQRERGPGEIIGEMALFSLARRRTATARCKTQCVVRKVPTEDAMRIYLHDPAFSVYLAKLLTRRLVEHQ